MHYIRFLKPPRFVPGARPPMLSAKITVTTDLGEAFLAEDIRLFVQLEIDNGDGKGRVLYTLGKEYVWKGRDGMRSLEVSICTQMGQAKQEGRTLKMLVRPRDAGFAVDSFASVLVKRDKDGGGVVTVRSLDVRTKTGGTSMAERVFSHGDGDKKLDVCIWEETGESIARHIWDAGVVLSSYLATASSQASVQRPPQLPLLQKTLSQNNLKVLELGAGCGIVGITLSHFFAPQISQVLLTDLAEASEILSQNLSPPVLGATNSQKISHQVLDWSEPLPDNIKSTSWDLIVVADCTYNPDVVPDLVNTLKALTGESKGALILLAMKVRHNSELIFFDLMKENDLVVREKCAIPLPVLSSEDEEIEVFVFGYQS